MAERWSVALDRHEPRSDGGQWVGPVQEMKIFLNEAQAESVRAAILATLAEDKPMMMVPPRT